MVDIRQYETMSKLSLTDGERENVCRDAEMLIKSFGAIDEINTGDTVPLVSPLELRNILREDASFQILPRDEILKNAPEQYDGYFVVPGTLD